MTEVEQSPAEPLTSRAELEPHVDNGDDALAKFRSNRFAGLLLFAGFMVIGLSSAR